MSSTEFSEQQRLAAAVTFGKKQSMITALGLTFRDPDPAEIVEAPTSATVTRSLVYAGLFLVAHELIKKLVIAPIIVFYRNTNLGSGFLFKSYEEDVLSLHKDVFEASLLYLRDHIKAITADQVCAIQAVRKHRNLVAHELSKQLASLDPLENERLLSAARDAVRSLSRHWTYVEIGCDPEFAALDPDWAHVCGEEAVLLDNHRSNAEAAQR